jgi:hypothetical protein
MTNGCSAAYKLRLNLRLARDIGEDFAKII